MKIPSPDLLESVNGSKKLENGIFADALINCRVIVHAAFRKIWKAAGARVLWSDFLRSGFWCFTVHLNRQGVSSK